MMKTINLPYENIYKGYLILVNEKYPYHEGLTRTDLKPVNTYDKNVLLEQHSVEFLSHMMEEINGWQQICAVSGWRSLQAQKAIYTQSLTDNGDAFTQQFVALPGHSEHQTGLAVDLGIRKEDIDFIRPDFPYTGMCKIFRQHSIRYGFIERYPKGKENITGIAHEPWHFRYVGYPHAAIMMEKDFCLEEYINFLKQFRYGDAPYFWRTENSDIAISYIAANGNDTQFQIAEDISYSISGNNVDGYIITEWRQV